MRNFNQNDNKAGRGQGFKSNFRKLSYGRGASNRFETHKAICSTCGNECEVPFKPTSGKPVYCNKCFRSVRQNEDRLFENTSERRSGSSEDQLKRQFETLNWKLDKILKILAPKVDAPQETVRLEKPKRDFTPLKFKKKKSSNN